MPERKPQELDVFWAKAQKVVPNKDWSRFVLRVMLGATFLEEEQYQNYLKKIKSL